MSDEPRIWGVRVDVRRDEGDNPGLGKYVADCVDYLGWGNTPEEAVADLNRGMEASLPDDAQLADIRDMHEELMELRAIWEQS